MDFGSRAEQTISPKSTLVIAAETNTEESRRQEKARCTLVQIVKVRKKFLHWPLCVDLQNRIQGASVGAGLCIFVYYFVY